MGAESLTLALPPGPPALPLLGHLPQLRSNLLGFLGGVVRAYGPVATFRVGRQPMVLMVRPEAVRDVLIERARVLTSAEFNVLLQPVLGRGLLTTDGEEHRRLRRMVQPAFHRRRVEGYRDMMVAQTERLLQSWRPGAVVDIGREMQHLTMNIIAEVLLGIHELDEMRPLAAAFDTASIRSRQVIMLRRVFAPGLGRVEERHWRGPLSHLPGTPHYHLTAARRTLDETVYALIAQRRSLGTDTGDVASALLAARDEDGSALDDAEIRDQLMTLLAAGHATTALSLTWTFYLLSQHPAVAGRLRAELRRELGGRPPTVADLERLTYLEMVWNEALRLYPPAWALGRLAREDVEIAGQRLPAGTLVMLSPYFTHRQPDLFREPLCFRPERFDPANGERHQPHSYFPFGGGPRMCIGAAFATLEGKLLLATIAQRFAPRLVPGHPVRPSAIVVLRPAHGMSMVLEVASD